MEYGAEISATGTEYAKLVSRSCFGTGSRVQWTEACGDPCGNGAIVTATKEGDQKDKKKRDSAALEKCEVVVFLCYIRALLYA